MRSFISGVCCFVVGLEVLIGVPLAVCLAFFAATQCGVGVVAYESNTGPTPSTIAPPSYTAGQPYFPPPVFTEPPSSSPVVSVDFPPPSGAEPAPTASGAATASSNTEFAAIVKEARLRNGSPLDGTLLDSPPLSATAPLDPVPSLQSIAADSSSASELARPVTSDLEPAPNANRVPSTEAAKPSVDDKPGQLQKSVQHLYAVAARYEEQGQFRRADQVRDLARGLREELALIRRDESLWREPLPEVPAVQSVEPRNAASEPLGTSY